MQSIGILLLCLGAFILYVVLKFLLNKEKFKSEFLKKEADRIVTQHAKADKTYSSQGRMFTKGLSVMRKKGDKKFQIIAQAKVCGLGLY